MAHPLLCDEGGDAEVLAVGERAVHVPSFGHVDIDDKDNGSEPINERAMRVVVAIGACSEVCQHRP